MSTIQKKQRFRGDVWFDQQVEQRTKKALHQKQIEFASAHKEDTNEQLLTYVRQAALELGYTPNAGEMIGGEYISSRFGNWGQVVQAAGLSPQGKLRDIKNGRFIKKSLSVRQLCLKGNAENKRKKRRWAYWNDMTQRSGTSWNEKRKTMPGVLSTNTIRTNSCWNICSNAPKNWDTAQQRLKLRVVVTLSRGSSRGPLLSNLQIYLYHKG